MKKLLTILGVVVLLVTSCTKNEENTGERAESEWSNFIQKHLIGVWKPESVRVKPPLGNPLIERNYSNFGNPKDVVTLRNDFTGQFTSYNAQGELKTVAFTWYHKLDELGIVLEDGRTLKTSILHKSNTTLNVSLALEHVYEDLKIHFPELDQLSKKDREQFIVQFNFVK